MAPRSVLLLLHPTPTTLLIKTRRYCSVRFFPSNCYADTCNIDDVIAYFRPAIVGPRSLWQRPRQVCMPFFFINQFCVAAHCVCFPIRTANFKLMPRLVCTLVICQHRLLSTSVAGLPLLVLMLLCAAFFLGVFHMTLAAVLLVQ